MELPKIGTIKDKNGEDLTEQIQKRWQEYIEYLNKKALNDPDNHDGESLTQSQTSWSMRSSGP